MEPYCPPRSEFGHGGSDSSHAIRVSGRGGRDLGSGDRGQSCDPWHCTHYNQKNHTIDHCWISMVILLLIRLLLLRMR